ncbi:MAG: GIY-YIG nuclease family protein [Tissierellia bacterium]|nr:GIY-YIG nuclease family protein [Tissierellia bacterium]
MDNKWKKFLEELPSSPGVYEFYSKENHLIYIGKSKNLRSRVRSYFNPSQNWKKAKRMIDHIHRIKITPTHTHLEAQLLELHRIFYKKPLFNHQMKNDRRLSYLNFDDERLVITTSKVPGKHHIGPITTSSRLYALLENLDKIQPIRKDYQFDYHVIGEGMDKNERILSYDHLKQILTDPEELTLFRFTLKEKMNQASRELNFEKAIFYRDLNTQLQTVHNFLIQRELFAKKDYVFCYPHKIIWIHKGIMMHGIPYKKDVPFEHQIESLCCLTPIEVKEKIYKYHRDIVYREFVNLKDSCIIPLNKQ